MEGVTTAIVLFIFTCVLMPRIVKHKPQYYMALAAVIGIIGIQAVGLAFSGKNSEGVESAFPHFTGFVAAFLQIVAILLLILACGGITAGELAGEFKSAYEVMRRGDQEKEIIIPLTGDQPKPRESRSSSGLSSRPSSGVSSRPPQAPRPRRPDAGGPIPLD